MQPARNPRTVRVERRWQEMAWRGRNFVVGWFWPAHPGLCAQTGRGCRDRCPRDYCPPRSQRLQILWQGKNRQWAGWAAPGAPEFTPDRIRRAGYVNALAKQGFVVLAHDTFLWGSRRFPLETMTQMVGRALRLEACLAAPPDPDVPAIAQYNTAAGLHEHWVERYCTILGTCLAGVVAYEDRVAFNYLLSRPDVDPGKVGCIGLSGGGNRLPCYRHPCFRAGGGDHRLDDHLPGAAGS